MERDRLQANEIHTLVRPDGAARGVHIKGVSHFFNFDVPWQPGGYTHRIGRPGRAGATGPAVTLATAQDADQLAAIEKLIGAPFPPMTGAAEPEPEKKPVKKARARKAAEPEARKQAPPAPEPRREEEACDPEPADRKSTRLNSSH